MSEDDPSAPEGSPSNGASGGSGPVRPRWRTWQRPPWPGSGNGRRRSQPWSWRRWLVVIGIGTAVVLAITFAAGRRGLDLPPRTVDDAEFVAQANAACERTLRPLREDRDRRQRGETDEAALRRRVLRAADDIERLSDEVRALPLAAGDQPDVYRWLDDWDAYVAVGRRFADVIGREDNKSYGQIAAQSAELSERIFVFAKANGMPECAF